MSASDIRIADRFIGPKHPPFIIAEMSGNHNQSLDNALAIVEAAAKNGAHALKLQTYTADTMTLDISEGDFHIDDPNSLWNGYSLYNLYKVAHTPWDWHKPIFDRCRELGIIGFSTPFDETAVDFLEDLNVPAYKIASFENIDLNLIARTASTGKPLIISTGLANVAEISEAVATAKDAGCKDLIILKCTSSYPASPENINLKTLPHMRELFDVQVGLSDHTLGIGVPIASVALGATVIEKHFILSREHEGVDSAFSMEPDELAQLMRETHAAWQALGRVSYEATPSEKASRIFRRSLYISQDIPQGQPITADNLRAIRPGKGLAPKYYCNLIGKKVRTDVKKGTPASWSLIE